MFGKTHIRMHLTSKQPPSFVRHILRWKIDKNRHVWTISLVFPTVFNFVFTQTEGQILIKLIHRQTGKNTYKLIKELRNGWIAFWYNNTARIFNMSLKKEFDPYTVEEDYLIEDIIQRALRDKKLEYQEPNINFDLFELNKKWEKEIIQKP